MRLWPLLELDAREVATWTPELRARFICAVHENRGAQVAIAFMEQVDLDPDALRVLQDNLWDLYA